MKKFILIISLLSFIPVFIKAQLTQIEADAIIQEYLDSEKIASNHWLYSNTSIVTRISEIQIIVDKMVSPDFNAWLYFIDELPFANWSHSCRYVFVDQGNGQVVTKSATLPPANLDKWRMITKFPQIPKGNKFDSLKKRPLP